MDEHLALYLAGHNEMPSLDITGSALNAPLLATRTHLISLFE